MLGLISESIISASYNLD